jgi:hypothetical protein
MPPERHAEREGTITLTARDLERELESAIASHVSNETLLFDFAGRYDFWL